MNIRQNLKSFRNVFKRSNEILSVKMNKHDFTSPSRPYFPFNHAKNFQKRTEFSFNKMQE